MIILVLKQRSNNTNKLSPQEPQEVTFYAFYCSNNTNKLSPQEPSFSPQQNTLVQIIQINLALKNQLRTITSSVMVQIIQINLALKNRNLHTAQHRLVQIIQINLALKNRR